MTSQTSLLYYSLERKNTLDMTKVYSTHEAKAKFSELLAFVRKGVHVVVTYRGVRVAEVLPYQSKSLSWEDRLARLKEEGVIIESKDRGRDFPKISNKKGALKRFLEERDQD